MAPMLKSEGPGRARCGYGSGVVDLSHTHARADALTGAKMHRCSRRRRCSRTQNHTHKPARTHARTHAHTHTHTHTPTPTQTHTATHYHTRSVTHTDAHTHRCAHTDAPRKIRIRHSTQRSGHAIAAVCHTHSFEGSDRCATFIDRIIGKTRASPAGPAQAAQARVSKQSHDPSRQRRVTNGTCFATRRRYQRCRWSILPLTIEGESSCGRFTVRRERA